VTAPSNIPIASPFLGEEKWQALREPIESGWLTQGPEHSPAAKDCNDHTMAIPLHNRMTADDYARVVESLHTL
jgi:dTDP-4-amino-4,6-dideoxygalactose transaminase